MGVETKNTELQAFYEDAKKRFGISTDEIRDILRSNVSFGGKFQKNRIPEYILYLKQVSEDVKSKASLDNYKEIVLIRSRMGRDDSLGNCPICGDGKTKANGWPWICLSGGVGHYLVFSVSQRLGVDPLEFAKEVEQIRSQKYEEMQAELAKWKEMMHDWKTKDGEENEKETPEQADSPGVARDEAR